MTRYHPNAIIIDISDPDHATAPDPIRIIGDTSFLPANLVQFKTIAQEPGVAIMTMQLNKIGLAASLPPATLRRWATGFVMMADSIEREAAEAASEALLKARNLGGAS
jgi:hypothetical protein